LLREVQIVQVDICNELYVLIRLTRKAQQIGIRLKNIEMNTDKVMRKQEGTCQAEMMDP
jgi:hypothetical protein